MKGLFLRLPLIAFFVLAASTSAFSGALDDHYLSAFGSQEVVQTGSVLQKAILLPSSEADALPHCGTPLKHGLQRDWNQLETSTQKSLAKQLSAPVLSGPESTLVSPSGRFRIHYTTSGADASSVTWVQTTAQIFDNVAAYYSDPARNWKLAPTLAGAPYDIYMRDLSTLKLYGQTTLGQALALPGFNYAGGSFVEIDNDYLEPVYQNALSGPLSTAQKALQSLEITAAHEYHHSIQYGYNYFFDVWYAEATSTWFEDELYDNVNQLYNYLPAALNNADLSLDTPTNTSTGGGYGRWLFNRHLAEAQGGQPLIRSFWERLATTVPPAVGDIPMSPILDAVLLTKTSTLGTELIAYASKLYTAAWTSHPADISLIHPVSMNGEYTSNLITVSSVPSPSITLPHLSFAFFKLTPPVSSPSTLTITLTRDSGIFAIAFRKINAAITAFTPAAGSNQIDIPGYNLAGEVVLLLVNPTGSDNLVAGFSTDGSPIVYALTGTTITAATPVVSPASITLSWSAVSSATSYQIFRSTTSSTSLILYTTSSATSFTDTNVVADHTYYYSVIPFQSVGQTGPASQVTAVKIPASAPAGSSGGGGGGGCFIATAAYGSYLHPQVQILRDFRDTWLVTNAPGRAFVALYYRLSPPVADFIAQHETLRLLVRLLLTPVIFVIGNLMSAVLITGSVLLGLQLRRVRLIMVRNSMPE